MSRAVDASTRPMTPALSWRSTRVFDILRKARPSGRQEHLLGRLHIMEAHKSPDMAVYSDSLRLQLNVWTIMRYALYFAARKLLYANKTGQAEATSGLQAWSKALIIGGLASQIIGGEGLRLLSRVKVMHPSPVMTRRQTYIKVLPFSGLSILYVRCKLEQRRAEDLTSRDVDAKRIQLAVKQLGERRTHTTRLGYHLFDPRLLPEPSSSDCSPDNLSMLICSFGNARLTVGFYRSFQEDQFLYHPSRHNPPLI